MPSSRSRLTPLPLSNHQLDFSRTSMSPKDLLWISYLLQEGWGQRALDFSGNEHLFSHANEKHLETFFSLIAYSPTLGTLSLNAVRVSGVVFTVFLRELKDVDETGGASKIHSLSLKRCALQTEELERLAEALSYLPNVNFLDVSQNDIMDRNGVLNFVSKVSKHTNLTSVSISVPTSVVNEKFEKALRKMSLQITKKTEDGCGAGVVCIDLTNSKDKVLQPQPRGTHGGHSVRHSIPAPKCLTLNVRYFSDQQMQLMVEVIKSLYSSLEELSLKGLEVKHVVPESLTVHLKEALISCQQLKILGLSGEASLDLATAALQEIPCLKRLNLVSLSENAFNETVVKKFSDALARHRTLRTLDLSGNYLLSHGIPEPLYEAMQQASIQEVVLKDISFRLQALYQLKYLTKAIDVDETSGALSLVLLQKEKHYMQRRLRKCKTVSEKERIKGEILELDKKSHQLLVKLIAEDDPMFQSINHVTWLGPIVQVDSDSEIELELQSEPASEPEATDALQLEPASESEAADALQLEPASEPEATDALQLEPASEPEAAEQSQLEPASEPEASEQSQLEPISESEATDALQLEPASEPEATEQPQLEPTSEPRPDEERKPENTSSSMSRMAFYCGCGFAAITTLVLGVLVYRCYCSDTTLHAAGANRQPPNNTGAFFQETKQLVTQQSYQKLNMRSES